MRFALDDEAAALRDAAREVLAAEQDRDAAWNKLVAVGAVGTLVPEDRGGLGLDENALVPLLEEIGYRGLAVPAVETIAVAAPLLDSVPDSMIAALLDDGNLLPFGQIAPLALLRRGPALRLYAQEELNLEPCVTVDDGRAMSRVLGAGGVAGVGNYGTELTRDPAVIEGAWQRGVLGTAAVLTGLTRRMLDMTVAYVRGREQFGVPVGSFQAIKHALADALVAIEFARPLVLAAGWAQASGAADANVLTSAAKARASDVARRVARTAIQCHGAMGYTTEYELHVFVKRAWALAPAWGDAAGHRALIAEKTIGVTDG